jgi:Family of unknown function (DUF5627)/Domain of unknown function (DUF1735)/Domain of unknown function (DUF4361)
MAIENLKFKMMKKILVYLPLFVLFLSCDSNEIKYDDFDYQTIYFPIQNPVRTIVLGDEIRSDNSIDLEKAFTIAANVGGLYENKTTRNLTIRLAPELVPTDPATLLITNTTPADTLVVLPPSYYNASSLSEIVIPAGKFDGRIRINLTDAFFNDPKSTTLKYVLPLLIESSKENDSILQGKKVVPNPIRTKIGDYEAGKRPKDYVLYAVNYANKYHGNYFHYGKDEVFKGGTTPLVPPKPAYNTPDIERNLVTLVTTTSLSESIVNRLGGTNVGGTFQMKLKVNPDNTITISQVKGGVAVSGTGKFIEAKDGISWGGVKHKTMYLQYEFTDAAKDVHKCKDTLVYRSSGIVYREFVLR